MTRIKNTDWDYLKSLWPEKFATFDEIFSRIHPGNKIFIGTACGEPQYLVKSLVDYIKANPRSLFDAELIQVWNLGITPYTDEKFSDNFRLNSFFVGEGTRRAVNRGQADYTPISLSTVPDLFRRGMISLDVALVNTSLPDSEGNVSLGISVDIVQSAVESASLKIAQVNSYMPFTYGDGILEMKNFDFIVPHDEPLLEYEDTISHEKAQELGFHVARIVEDGATLQVGYGSVPNAIISNLKDKHHLGLHSELFSDGVAELMNLGVIDNSRKSLDNGKSVASFCMGKKETYDFLDRNPSVEFRSIDYTNNPLIISRQKGMTAINSALEIDLTGQATAESLGGMFYSGIGGQTDFMRGALLAPQGRTILALSSTSWDGKFSRIVPRLSPGSGVTLCRSDLRYVVTEYGVAYLHGKSIRERTMELIAIAHPSFRPWLLEEARSLRLIYKDQAFITGERGKYPEALETYRTTRTGLRLFLRPVKISDEPLLKDFFYSLSDQSMYLRFASSRKDMPHQRLQEFVVVDYSRNMIILSLVKIDERDIVIGLGQYSIDEKTHTAELALVVRDDYQNQGVGTELHAYLTYLAKRSGLLGFTAEVLKSNQPALNILRKLGFELEDYEGAYEAKISFNKTEY
ncbi:MAG: GNAT family N-acetyltransferase [Methanotrichaceae archaeon]|nr:GNAT family N-acetyltransferase [Methanotrichaceae archaeon]